MFHFVGAKPYILTVPLNDMHAAKWTFVQLGGRQKSAVTEESVESEVARPPEPSNESAFL